MNFSSIKLKIAVNLAVILLIAMVLIDFIVITTGQSNFTDTEITKGELFAALVEKNLIVSNTGESVVLPMDFQKKVNEMIQDYEIARFILLDKQLNPIHVSKNRFEYDKKLFQLVRQSLQTQKKKSYYQGDTWGIFWKQRQNIFLAIPLYHENRLIAGAGIVIQLEGFYNSMRQSHQIVILYILFNTIVLTLFGLYRMVKLIIHPIHRLVKRAEEYRDDSHLVFKSEKEENEFGQLSKALNSMMNKISNDRETLKQSVTSLEKANIEIKKAQKEIIRAEKLASVGRLAAGIAHEIGNPIGIVLGYLGLLKGNAISSEERSDYIRRAEDEISRIKSIIRELLDFSRPSEEISENVAVHAIISETTDILKIQPIMNEIEIRLMLDASHDIVYADPNQLRQVFVNLMMNAADAISSSGKPEKGVLTVKTELGSESVCKGLKSCLVIRIIDNGIGISNKNLETIFDPFFTTKEPGKGTGLGLSVCFMIIEQAGGNIKAESTEGQGTTITICLPVRFA
jgi:two-component system, NtrC family, sensor kinase